jgi:hypothetical protein
MFSSKYPIRLILIALVMLLAGCTKFIYNQLDWLIPWYLDDYVSLNSRQEVMFEERLKGYLDWHRKQQLPVYADFLDAIAKSVESGLGMPDLDKFQSHMEFLTDQLFIHLAPALLDLFEDLDDAQVEELMHNLARENEEYREEYVHTAEKNQRNRRFMKLQKFIERWVGELEEHQLGMLETWSQQYRMMGAEFIHARQVWQKRLHEILKRRREHDFLQPSLNEIFTNRRIGRTEQHQTKLKFNEMLLKRLYLDLHPSLSSLQRSHLVKKLKSYAADFRQLSRQ